MNRYNFSTDEFGVNESGFHLLRNRFQYETIDFTEINRIRIVKGPELNNWWIVFIIGIILLIPGIGLGVDVVNAFLRDDLKPSAAGMVLFLLIPVVGGYFIYSSLQQGLLIILNYSENKIKRLSLQRICKAGQLKEFELFLKQKTG